jgi:putative inorganic carbon (HCO3(-)) transporter
MLSVSRYGTLMRDTGRVLLLTALVAYPLLAGKSFRWQVLVMHCVVALAALLWYTGAAMPGQRPHVIRYRALDGALLAFVVWCVVALLLAVYKYAGLVFLLTLVDCLLVYWMAREGFRERRWRWAVPMALVVAGAICGLWAMREYAHTVILSGEKAWRVFGPLYNPNVLASYLIGPLLIGAALLLSRHQWMRQSADGDDRHVHDGRSEGPVQRPRYGLIALGFSLLLIGSSILLTGSRAGLVGAMAGLAFFALLAVRSAQGRRLTAVLSVVLAVLALLAVLFVPPLHNRVLRDFSLDNHSIAFRYYTWLGTLQMAHDRPLLGFGPGSYEYVYSTYAQAGYTRMAHQSFLQIAAEVGWPGLLIALMVGVAALWCCWLRAQEHDGIGAVVSAAAAGWLLAIAVHNLADYSMYIPAVMVSVAGILGVALAPVPAKPADDHSPTAPAAAPASAAWCAKSRSSAGFVALAIVLLVGLWLASGEVLIVRSEAQRQRGSYNRAEDLAKVAAQLVSCSSEAWETLAAVHEARVRSADSLYLRKAIDARLQAVRCAPTSARSYRALARLYALGGDMDRALGYAEAAVERYPIGVKELVELAQVQLQAGRDVAATETYQRTVALLDGPAGKYAAIPEIPETGYVWAWAYLADAAYAEGRIAEAHVMVYEALRRLVGRLRAEEQRFELEQTLLNRRPPQMAELETMADRLTEVMRPHPDSINYLWLAEARRRLGQWAMQETVLLQVVSVAGDARDSASLLLSGVAHLEQGQLYQRWNRKQQASEAYVRGLEAIERAGPDARDNLTRAAGRSPIDVETLDSLIRSAKSWTAEH